MSRIVADVERSRAHRVSSRARVRGSKVRLRRVWFRAGVLVGLALRVDPAADVLRTVEEAAPLASTFPRNDTAAWTRPAKMASFTACRPTCRPSTRRTASTCPRSTVTVPGPYPCRLASCSTGVALSTLRTPTPTTRSAPSPRTASQFSIGCRPDAAATAGLTHALSGVGSRAPRRGRIPKERPARVRHPGPSLISGRERLPAGLRPVAR